jgi:putative endonuclease
MRDYHFTVYILASRRNGTLYVGVTNDIVRRMWEHREGIASKFTARYGVTKLVYSEQFEDVHAAIARETRLKKYKRAWKINLIQQQNVEWDDLAASWFQPQPLPEWLTAPQPTIQN